MSDVFDVSGKMLGKGGHCDESDGWDISNRLTSSQKKPIDHQLEDSGKGRAKFPHSASEKKTENSNCQIIAKVTEIINRHSNAIHMG